MLQSIQKGSKTEIDSINGFIVKAGKQFGIDVTLNEVIIYIINNL
jgi:ketopantoate reductase